jgi:hypothetical protein
VHARFAEADLPSILDHHARARPTGPTRRAGDDRSLTQGTARWAALGQAGTQVATGKAGRSGEAAKEVSP